MKCDTCIFKQYYRGAGAPDDYSTEYCDNGHWEGLGPDPMVDEPDPWADCPDYQEDPIPAIKAALEQSKNLLDNLIQQVDDLTPDQIEVAMQFIDIKTECHCDCYVGFDCGCGQYYFIQTEGLKALEALKNQNQ